MKPRIFYLSLFVVLGLAGQVSATYQPSYASYNAISLGSDGQTVYSTVTLQGTTTGDCSYNGGTIPGCEGALHTPRIYNKVGTAGGWRIGQTVSMWTYINSQDTTSFVATPGVQYQIQAGSVISCTAGGVFPVPPFFSQFFLVATTLSRFTGNTSNCAWDPVRRVDICDFSTASNCTPETTPPTWDPTAVKDSMPPLAGWWSFGLCLRVLSTDPWSCAGGLALKTTQTTPDVCTKVP